MWLLGSYSSILKMYLKKYKNLKIHFDNNGKVHQIEKEENGYWKIIATSKLNPEKLPVNSSIYNNTNFKNVRR